MSEPITHLPQHGLRIISEEIHYVSVSGKVYEWPCMCPCCGSGITLPASHVVAGITCLKITDGKFSPRYCRPCKEHITRSKFLKPAPSSSSCAPFIFGCGCGPFILGLVSGSVYPLVKNNEAACAIGILVAGAAIYGFTYFFGKNQDARQKEARDASLAVQEVMTPYCAHQTRAAWLDSKRESFKRFAFRNPDFARLFEQVNAKRTVR